MGYRTYTLIDNYSVPHTIRIPVYYNRTSTTAHNTNKTLSEIVRLYPEFLSNVTYFTTTPHNRNMLVLAGLTDVISIDEHIGERWYFTNGNYIEFMENIINLNNANGEVLYNITLSGYFNTRTLPQTEIIFNNIHYSGTLYPSSPDKLNIYRDYLLGSEEYNTPLEDFYRGIDIPSTDPYEQGGTSTTGGGTGDFDNEGELITPPELPTSVTDLGFFTLFKPNETELKALSSYMWSSNFFDQIKKLFASPMEAIISLTKVPFDVQATNRKDLSVGGVPIVYDGGRATMLKVDNQYIDIDCGTLNINEYWGSYLDYAPYTKIQLYLPFINIVTINTDDVMGKAINVKYRIDLLSGVCVAYISCGSTILYTFTGNCAYQIPISTVSYGNIINSSLGLMGTALAVTGTAVTGGLSAPLTIGALGNTATNVMNMKPQIARSGALSGSATMLNIMTPYIIVTRPRQCLPENQNVFTGYPSYITATLGDLTGFTIVQDIHLENIGCTDNELNEIEGMLKKGVIL